MVNSMQSFRSAFVFSSGILVGSAQAFADVGASGFQLEEVVVTARKVEENIQRAPIAVTALSGDELVDIRGVVKITDISAFVPNVNLSSHGPTGGTSAFPTVFIRGMGQSDFNIVADPGVGIYVDGVFVSRGVGGLLDVTDVDRLEVLRGPQGTLFGRNSIGGAINMISKKPNEVTSGEIAITLGEDNQQIVRGMFNLPLSETVFARVSAQYDHQDGFVNTRQYEDSDYKLGEQNSVTAKVALRWLASDIFTVDAGVDYTTSEETPAPYHTVSLTGINGGESGPNSGFGVGFNNSVGGDCLTDLGRQTNPDCYGAVWHAPNPYTSDSVFFDPSGNKIKAENESDIFGGHITMTWDLPLGTLKSISAYREVEASFINDAEGSPFLVTQNANRDYSNESFSQEFQWVGSAFDGNLDYVTGFYYFEEEGVQNVLLQFFGIDPVAQPGNTGGIFSNDFRSIDNTSTAAYAQGTWHFNDKAHLTLGLRHTKDKKEVNFDLNRDEYTVAGPRSQNFDGKFDVSVTDPLVTFGYDFSDKLFTYASYTEGFRDGGFPGRFLGSPTEADSYDSEYVSSIEAGIKYTSPDNSLRANLAIFMTDYEDFQVAANSADPTLQTTVIDNLADVSLNGLELEIYWVAAESLRFDLALGYLDNEIDSVVGGQLSSLGVTIDTDSSIPFAPEWSGNLGVTHNLALSGGSSLLTRFDFRYVDEQYFRIENTDTLLGDSYSTVNWSTTYRFASTPLEIQLGAKNLLDEEYSTSAGVVGASSSVIRNISRPRTFYATLRYFMGG